ncbi:TIGR02677 family protein [Frankia sp. R82]|uniref:TIGR02677 family protein n=1 Tax=Frankia sp. R82 TaxID=2950553 RepID=UPI0020436249|nr:TIGR02677 family protein [Frankia sp. R82]MCM3887340.1 TIGR02677 family protein [Frankia sp. R82]
MPDCSDGPAATDPAIAGAGDLAGGGVGAGRDEGVDRSERLRLFAYLTADRADDYLAIMSLFTETLLTDLSAAEAADALARAAGGTHAACGVLSADEVEQRCQQLELWGNLVRSVRDARVSTVRDYWRSRSRYQISKLGGQVHRQAVEILAATDRAREVARELLGGIVDTLDRILAHLALTHPAAAGIDVDALAADVTSVFASQRLFTESVRDFYAYLSQVLARYDLAGAEYAEFKTLLLEYIDLITADVTRHAPAVETRLARLEPLLDQLLAALATLPTLSGPDGTRAERSPGRERSDWEEIAAWYSGRAGRSGPAQFRAAAEQALGQLIANAKRMLAAGGTGVSRRADFLRLARWFSDAATDDAHRLYAAAFGVYPSRHLLGGPEEQSARAGASTSWWEADPVDVAVSLREHGDRTARGRGSRVPDPGLDREALLAEAEAAAAAGRAAAAELVAARELDGARISPAARDLLLDRLGDLLAVHQELTEPVDVHDTDLRLVLTAVPGPGERTVVHAPDGTLTVHDLRLIVTSTTATTATTGAAAVPVHTGRRPFGTGTDG